MAAAPALSPALATITTRSAEAISSTRFLVRPARSLSQPPSEKRSGALPEAAPAKAEAVRKLAPCHELRASSLTTRSLAASSAMTLTARGREFGASMRNFASAAELMRADSLCILILPKQYGRATIAKRAPYFIVGMVLYNGRLSFLKRSLADFRRDSDVLYRQTSRSLRHQRGRARHRAQGRDRRSGAGGVQYRWRILRHRRPVHAWPRLAV